MADTKKYLVHGFVLEKRNRFITQFAQKQNKQPFKVIARTSKKEEKTFLSLLRCENTIRLSLLIASSRSLTMYIMLTETCLTRFYVNCIVIRLKRIRQSLSLRDTRPLRVIGSSNEAHTVDA